MLIFYFCFKHTFLWCIELHIIISSICASLQYNVPTYPNDKVTIIVKVWRANLSNGNPLFVALFDFKYYQRIYLANRKKFMKAINCSEPHLAIFYLILQCKKNLNLIFICILKKEIMFLQKEAKTLFRSFLIWLKWIFFCKNSNNNNGKYVSCTIPNVNKKEIPNEQVHIVAHGIAINVQRVPRDF